MSPICIVEFFYKNNFDCDYNLSLIHLMQFFRAQTFKKKMENRFRGLSISLHAAFRTILLLEKWVMLQWYLHFHVICLVFIS